MVRNDSPIHHRALSRMVLVNPLNETFFVLSVQHEGADLQCGVYVLREFFYFHVTQY